MHSLLPSEPGVWTPPKVRGFLTLLLHFKWNQKKRLSHASSVSVAQGTTLKRLIVTCDICNDPVSQEGPVAMSWRAGPHCSSLRGLSSAFNRKEQKQALYNRPRKGTLLKAVEESEPLGGLSGRIHIPSPKSRHSCDSVVAFPRPRVFPFVFRLPG